MSNILIKGFYGQNNLGDDYILYSILDTLNSTGNHKVNIISAGDANYSNLFTKFDNLECHLIPRENWRRFSKLSLLLKCNRWIIGGGWSLAF